MRQPRWSYSNRYEENNPDFAKVKDSKPLVKAARTYIADYFAESKATYDKLLKKSAS